MTCRNVSSGGIMPEVKLCAGLSKTLYSLNYENVFTYFNYPMKLVL